MRSKLVWLALTIPLWCALGCKKAPPVSATEVVAVHQDVLPADLDDAVWQQAAVHVAPLLTQDTVEPRLLEPSTREVRVQAATDGARVAFRLEWQDASIDDLPGASRFSDACAIQLPAKTSPDVPSPEMGEQDRAVEITYWSAAWQATVNGRGDTIQELYPGAAVDHYPFEAPSLTEGSPEQQALARAYAPARELGNPMAGPRESPVQDLIAEGPGTLSPAPKQVSAGLGKRNETGWVVMLIRPLARDVEPGQRSQIAFGIWQGSNQEVGARKMRSAWIPLFVERPND